jgi:hypothetical protein
MIQCCIYVVCVAPLALALHNSSSSCSFSISISISISISLSISTPSRPPGGFPAAAEPYRTLGSYAPPSAAPGLSRPTDLRARKQRDLQFHTLLTYLPTYLHLTLDGLTLSATSAQLDLSLLPLHAHPSRAPSCIAENTLHLFSSWSSRFSGRSSFDSLVLCVSLPRCVDTPATTTAFSAALVAPASCRPPGPHSCCL